jgi:hypothetical protein
MFLSRFADQKNVRRASIAGLAAPTCEPCAVSLERPDSVTASAVSAREEIGRAVAAKIREVHDAKELKKVAEDVLPQIEKFLESPEEKRMRRIRSGVVVAAAGLGGTVFMSLMSAFLRGPDAETFLGLAGLGVACFLIGIGLIVNALFFYQAARPD